MLALFLFLVSHKILLLTPVREMTMKKPEVCYLVMHNMEL